MRQLFLRQRITVPMLGEHHETLCVTTFMLQLPELSHAQWFLSSPPECFPSTTTHPVAATAVSNSAFGNARNDLSWEERISLASHASPGFGFLCSYVSTTGPLSDSRNLELGSVPPPRLVHLGLGEDVCARSAQRNYARRHEKRILDDWQFDAIGQPNFNLETYLGA